MGIFDMVFRRKKKDDISKNLYVNSCLQVDFEELDDDRWWYKMDDMKRIQELEASGELKRALAIAETTLPKYPDFYFLFCKIGYLMDNLGRSDEAEQVYFQGLQKSRSKVDICSSLGTRAFERGDFKEAVRWWMKSSVAQLTTRRLVQGFPFLNLAYIAQGFGLKAGYKWLLTLADRADPRVIRFDAEGANQRYRVASHQDSDDIKQVIVALWKQYR